jgi:hypothetical protein
MILSSINTLLYRLFEVRLFLIKKSTFLQFFMWLSDSHTKLLIRLVNSSKNWLILLWFYTTCSCLFIDVGWGWWLRITLVLQSRFLLGQVANHLNMILTYLERCLRQLVSDLVLLFDYIPLIFSLSHFLIFFLPSFG